MFHSISKDIARIPIVIEVAAIITLLKVVVCVIEQRENRFNPQEMILPLKGIITLEIALHWMSIKIGIIMWDTVFGFLLGILLFMMVFLGGNIFRILLISFTLLLFLIGGHFFGRGDGKNVLLQIK